MQARGERGFSLVEFLVSVTVLVLAMIGLASLLIQNARINKSQQMAAEAQANARNTLSMVVQKLRSAGWDPTNNGFRRSTSIPTSPIRSARSRCLPTSTRTVTTTTWTSRC